MATVVSCGKDSPMEDYASTRGNLNDSTEHSGIRIDSPWVELADTIQF